MDSTDQDIELVAERLGEELVERILRKESLDVISQLLDSGYPVWYQNLVEGTSPLHAAAYVQDLELARLLLAKGAVWNAADNIGNTAGDIALSFNNEALYNLIRDTGIRSELLLGRLSSSASKSSASALILNSIDESAIGSSEAFLTSRLRYVKDDNDQDICLLEVDEEEVGVMMGWETKLMKETVDKLLGGYPNASKLSVLNVGFGLGIFDSFCQQFDQPPKIHVIIEAHPDVLQFMRDKGWYDKAGVTILEGRWQDVITTPAFQSIGKFDVVYTDTFSEDYTQLRDFFKELPNILAGPDGRFSFFNGLGATNALFYDVYTRVSEIDLDGIGLDVKWSDVDVIHEAKENRWGRSRQYFSLPVYRLPIATLKKDTK